MYEEIYMTLIFVGALFFPTIFATAVSLLALIMLFLKPYLSYNLRYIIQIVICALTIFFSLFAIYIKIDVISKINFDKGFIDSIYDALYGTSDKDQGYFVTFLYEIIVLISFLLVLLFSV